MLFKYENIIIAWYSMDIITNLNLVSLDSDGFVFLCKY